MARQLEVCNFAATIAKAKTMDVAALQWTIRDCVQAARAADAMDREGFPNNSGKYWDEYFTYSEELSRRLGVKRPAIPGRL